MHRLVGKEPEVDVGGTFDFWETPTKAVAIILPKVPSPAGTDGNITLIDPCAGRGAVAIAAIQHGLSVGHVVTVEQSSALVEASVAKFKLEVGDHIQHTAVHKDWLEWGNTQDFPGSLIIGNPPYTKPRETIGMECTEHALQLGTRWGSVVALLLPLDFATGKTRTERIHAKYATSVHPLKRRPCFGGTEHSGKRPFAWFIWDLGRKTKPTFSVVW